MFLGGGYGKNKNAKDKFQQHSLSVGMKHGEIIHRDSECTGHWTDILWSFGICVCVGVSI